MLTTVFLVRLLNAVVDQYLNDVETLSKTAA
jgi:hypothetical protein